MTPETTTEHDIRAMREQGDLPQFFAEIIAGALDRNAHRKALVNRYPDLAARIAQLPGHAKWTGSVGGNAHTAAIVAEAEQRAAHTTPQPHAPHTATQHA